MGLFDKAKKLAEEHAEQVGDAIDKVADAVDHKTGGKYSDKIDKGADAAKGFIGDDDNEGGGPAATPPAAPPAAPPA